MNDALALIVARMGSTRLPGKSLLPILGRPLLARMVERVRRSASVGPIVLATSTSPADDAIEALADELAGSDVRCHRGPEEDVLGRLAGALREHDASVALQLLGDNPLVHHEQIDAACRRLAAGDVDYVVTAAPELPGLPPALRRFPVGLRVEAFRPVVIERCARAAAEAYHREHATSFVHRDGAAFRIAYLEAPAELAELAERGLSYAVNTDADYRRVCAIFEALYPHDPDFPLAAVAALAGAGGRAAVGPAGEQDSGARTP